MAVSSVKAKAEDGGNGSIPARRRRPRPYLRSGLYARPTLPSADTEVGRVLAERRQGLVRDLGGDLTTSQAALVDLAITQWAMVEATDAFILSLPNGPVDRRHR